jgi:hypothetical protein
VILMGTYSRKKHYSERGGGASEASSSDDSQRKLTSYGTLRINKSDVDDFLLPVLKEVGKCIYPPAAIPIELLYQVYKHANTIKQVGTAVMKGDYDQAAKVIVKESVKKGAGMALGSAMEPKINQTSETLAEGVKNNLPISEQSKDIAGKVAKGTAKGIVEAVRGKVVNKVVDEVLKDEK